MRLLLVNPKSPESFWSFKWAISDVLPGKRAVNPPLGLATLAALSPDHWEIQIVDENIESVPLAPVADIVGVCGMGVQFARQSELLTYYRNAGYYVVAGGSYASLCPESYAALADTVVAGEAEYIWKEFCRDFERGEAKPVYRERGTVALSDSPVPRFDLLKLDLYANVAIQFSRGCPFRCEFCDIIVMFGRKPRMKTLDQVGRELDELRRLGVRNLFFVDDNLIGNPQQAKELLRFLKRYQTEHAHVFSIGTEASLNLAQDTEMLTLFREANFSWVFIGIESPDAASLQETHKTQNLREDLLTSVRRIYSFGIDVLAGFIIGFDNDTLATFDRQYQFITESGIASAMIGLLVALPKTPLYERVEREGRLRQDDALADNTRPTTNIVPKNMDVETMIGAYQALYARLLTSAEIARRIRNKIRYVRAPVYQSGYTFRQKLGIFSRLLFRGVIPGGVRQTVRFLGLLPIFSPSRFPLVLSDWIIGLSMQRFAQRHLFNAAGATVEVERRVASVHAAIERYLAQGKVTLNLRQAEFPDLALSLSGLLDRRFFRRVTPQLRRLLDDTRTRITLRIDRLERPQIRQFERMLQRLRRHGDRVFIVADNSLGDRMTIDSSVFNLVFSRTADCRPAQPH
jgi:radical SAM superfamily enzyme YgiQ (UPF0313 family)